MRNGFGDGVAPRLFGRWCFVEFVVLVLHAPKSLKLLSVLSVSTVGADWLQWISLQRGSHQQDQ